MPGAGIGAAVDVGSNSVHLLVARHAAGTLAPLRDESVLLGLGDEVDRDGELSEASIGALVAALAGYVAEARRLGAQAVTLLGTEPLRRARNAAAVSARVHDDVGLPLHVLSVQQEGELTYLAVGGGGPMAEALLVVDIGGGSTEVVLATPGQGLEVIGLPSGSARLSNGIVAHDPPTTDELGRLRAAARRLVDALPPAQLQRAVFVGGTATNLAHLAPLDSGGLARANHTLTSLPASEISATFGVNLRRARQLPAGAAIVEALLDHFALPAAEVSQVSLRDGAIIAAAHLGEGWPRRLGELVTRSAAQRPRASGGGCTPRAAGN